MNEVRMRNEKYRHENGNERVIIGKWCEKEAIGKEGNR